MGVATEPEACVALELAEDAVWLELETAGAWECPLALQEALEIASNATRAAAQNVAVASLCVAIWHSCLGVRSRCSSPLTSPAAYTETPVASSAPKFRQSMEACEAGDKPPAQPLDWRHGDATQGALSPTAKESAEAA